MTRKEARIYLEDVFPVLNTEMREAIQTLTQEPCEDAISRQAVLELIADYDLSMGQVVKGIHALPSVKPQEPILDKIRDEIMQLGYEVEVVDYDHNDITRIKKAHWIIREEVLWIIDKYKKAVRIDDKNIDNKL